MKTTSAVLTSAILAVCASSAALAERKYPVTAVQDSGDMGGFHMHTTATISDNGRVDLITNINNHTAFNGHCGAAFVYIIDKDGNKLGDPHTGGQWCVDGKSVPFSGPSDRTIPWSFIIDGATFRRASGFTIFYSQGSKPEAIDNFIQSVRQKLKACPECLQFLAH